MGENSGGAKNHRKCHQLSASQYKIEDRFDRCWSGARIDVPQSEAEAVAVDCALPIDTAVFLPSTVLAMVGERDFGQGFCLAALGVPAADGELGDLLAACAKLKWWRESRRGEFCAIVRAPDTDGTLDDALLCSFTNCRHIGDKHSAVGQAFKAKVELESLGKRQSQTKEEGVEVK